MHYLDNNATTKPCAEAKEQMRKWGALCSNPSGSSKASLAAKAMIEKSKLYVAKLLNAGDYNIIFTSNATEANCLIIRSITDAWNMRKAIPHIISSSYEHKSILMCLLQLSDLGRINLTLIKPDSRGIISPSSLDTAFQKNTALVTIMGANNEIGSINPLKEIAAKCNSRKIPFHSDCVQLFGKARLDLPTLGIAAISVSFHKLYGPQGVGMLVISKKLCDGYKLQGQLSGTQEGGLRGGTENVAGIAASTAAMIHNFAQRRQKNVKLLACKKAFISTLAKFYPVVDDYKKSPTTGFSIFILGPSPYSSQSLPNTILLSVISHEHTMCNAKMKIGMEKCGHIISIGSACNTSSPKASHVLDALSMPPLVKRGTLRISFGDYNTTSEATKAAIDLAKIAKNSY